MAPLSGYVRVSRVGGREGEGFISPEVQERAIRDWAARNSAEVVIEPHELDVSGGTMDRPVFNSIMEKVRAGESGGIVVYKLDRFARNLLGAISTLAELGKHGAVLVSATEPTLDYSSPSGRAFLHTLFVFAEFVRDSVKESWAVSQRSAIERGIHISPTQYLGYDRGADGRLRPNEQAAIAREMFERRAEGHGWGQIARWLNEVAPREGRQWTGQAVQRLCAKRVYRGEASRYVAQDRDRRGPIVNPGAHEPIVDEGLWKAAQMKPRATPSKGDKPLPLLAGLARCAGCRYSLSRGKGPQGERMYRCRKRHASGTCPNPAMILADTLEPYVEGVILREIDGIAKLVPDSTERDRLIAEVEQARRDYQDFLTDRETRRKLPREDWHATLDHYQAALRDAELKLAELDQRIGVVRTGLTRELYTELSVDDRREVIAGFIDCVFIRKSRGRGRHVEPVEKRTRILWRGQAPDDLPRRRVVNPIKSFDFEDDVEAGISATKDAPEGR